jgi:WD40 repeat protein
MLGWLVLTGLSGQSTWADDLPSADALADPLPAGAVCRLGTSRLRHPGGVSSAVFTPDGKWLVTGGRQRAVCVWDVASGKLVRELTFFTPTSQWARHGWRTAVAVSPDGGLLAGGTGGAIQLWDLKRGRTLQQLELDDHLNDLHALHISPSGDALLVVDRHRATAIRPLRGGQVGDAKPLENHVGLDRRRGRVRRQDPRARAQLRGAGQRRGRGGLAR